MAAHTTFGQAQHAAGIAIDLTSLAAIGAITDGTVTVDAGGRARRPARRHPRRGMMPPVLPDYIGQTVGGTLSVGGIRAMSFRDGAQIDHVVALRAVTGDGASWMCSEDRHRDLFEALLAGQGQVGIIDRGHAATRAGADDGARPRPPTCTPDLAAPARDLALLAEDRRFDQMEAFVDPDRPGEVAVPAGGGGIPRRPGPPDDTALGKASPARRAGRRPEAFDLDFLEWSAG